VVEGCEWRGIIVCELMFIVCVPVCGKLQKVVALDNNNVMLLFCGWRLWLAWCYYV